jgi:hypothetical protein
MTMRSLKFPAMVAAALGLFGTAAGARAGDPQQQTSPAQPSTSSASDLMRQIDQLQAQVQKLEAAQRDRQAQPSSTSQAAIAQTTNDTVERVLRDAHQRSQLMQLDEGFMAGYNNGRFVIGSADGNFMFMPFLQLQVRNTTNYIEDPSNVENGFNLPRVKVGFDGNAFSKELTYFFLWNSGESDGGGGGGLTLEQAWVRYEFNEEHTFGIRLGQFVDPVFHEQLVASQYQMAADRSLLNLIITGANESYTQGVTFIWNPTDRVNLEGGFTDGTNTGNTSFRDFPTGPTDFGFAGRAEFVLAGRPADSRKFSSWGVKEDMVLLGFGADWTQAGDTDSILHTADIQWTSAGGFSIYGAFVGQYIRNGGGAGITGITAGGDDSYNWGAIGQLAYLFPDSNFELFGRYDYTRTDDPLAIPGGSENEFHEITAGVNYYFYGHNAKFTLDATYLPNGAPAGADQLGILTSDDNQFVLRGQFQLML